MAKKRQIILTHGSAMPGAEVVKDLKLGEVLVQHDADAKKAALHTLLKEGEEGVDPVLVSFPSKDYVDAEIAKVDAGGINSTITALEDRVDVIEKDYLKADDKTALEGKITEEATARVEADNAINAKFGAGIGTGENEKTVAAAIAAEASAREAADNGLQLAIDGKVGNTEYTQQMGEIDADINGLESLLSGFEGEGAVKNAVDAKVAQSAYDTKIDEIDDLLKGLQGQFDELEENFYTEGEIDSKVDVINKAVAAATTTLTEAAPAEGIKVVKTNDTDGHANYEVTAVGLATETEMNAVEGRLDVIEGGDSGKSMRTVAAEEVAKVVAEAPDKFDTLQEIAAWIENDATGAASMANDIKAVKDTLTGFDTTYTVKKVTNALDDRIKAVADDYLKAADKTALEGKITEEATARENADKAIEAKLGAGFDAEKTVAAAIAAEAGAREAADNALDVRVKAIADDYLKAADKTELSDDIAEEADARVEADNAINAKFGAGIGTGENEKTVAAAIAAEADARAKADGALQVAIDGLNASVVKSVVVKDAEGNVVATYAPVNNVLDLSALVIDGGTY